MLGVGRRWKVRSVGLVRWLGEDIVDKRLLLEPDGEERSSDGS